MPRGPLYTKHTSMQLIFLGTGTSMGVPVIGCTCPVCTSTDPHNKRMRTSALLRVDAQQMLIDAGPDFRTQALRVGLQRLDALLLTHAHFDHVAGIDDVRPLNFRQRTPLPIYGSERTLRDVSERFSYAFSDTADGSTRPSLELHAVSGPFTVGGSTITPLPVMHGTWPIIGYRIGGLGYVTDASLVPAETMRLLRGVDVLVLNALRFEPHPTHFSLAQALEVIAELQPRQAYLVHLTHAFEHEAVNAQLPEGVQLAYDGLMVELCAPQ